MKLRILGNTIRLRLKMTEIEQLSKAGSVSETVGFAPERALAYTVSSDRGVDSITTSFENDEILIKVPENLVKGWCETEEIGLNASQVIDEHSSLNILLEKDFKCLTRRDGEEDMFPNPKEAHA